MTTPRSSCRQPSGDLSSLACPRSTPNYLFHSFRCSDFSHEERQRADRQAALCTALDVLRSGVPLYVGRYPEGIHRRLNLITDLGNKGMIAHAVRYNGDVEEPFVGLPTYTLAFFPAAQDAPRYFEAGAFSFRGGPSDLYPGSVGALEILYDPHKAVAQIVLLQSSVNYNHPHAQTIIRSPHSDLGNKYFGWMDRLILEGFSFLRRIGITKVSIADNDDPRFPLTTSVRNRGVIEKKALQCGCKLSRDRRALIAPRRRRGQDPS